MSAPAPGRAALWAVLALAVALRLAVLWLAPGAIHPDEIYQYFEPAHRLLTGDGLVTWEWREGMRGWLLPSLIAVPMAIGRALGGAILVPALAMLALSLAIVASAWRLGLRESPQVALVAAVVAASWCTLVRLAPHTLSEPIATALLFPAALWLADRDTRPRWLAAAGALVALAVIARPHYAPAAGVLVLVALGRRLPQAIVPVALGGLAALALGGLADLAQGQPPLAWIVENVRLNVVENRAANWGVEPPAFYLTHWLNGWGWWTPVVAIGFIFGWRASPALAVAALVNLAVHSLIGHKEPRFVFLTEAVLVMLAAIGTARLAARWRVSPLVVAAGWMVATAIIATRPGAMADARTMHPGVIAFEALRQDRQACGLALVGASIGEAPGRSHLPAGLPMAQFADRDPRIPGDPRAAFAPFAPAYNRVFAPAARPPAGFSPLLCAHDRVEPYCLYERPGGCSPRPGMADWATQAVLDRSGR